MCQVRQRWVATCLVEVCRLKIIFLSSAAVSYGCLGFGEGVLSQKDFYPSPAVCPVATRWVEVPENHLTRRRTMHAYTLLFFVGL